MPSLARNRSSGGSSGSRHDPEREEAAVPVAPRRVPFLDPCEVEEGRREGRRPSGRSPRSTCSQAAASVGNVVAETEIAGADRVEHPAGASLDPSSGIRVRAPPSQQPGSRATRGPGVVARETAST